MKHLFSSSSSCQFLTRNVPPPLSPVHTHTHLAGAASGCPFSFHIPPSRPPPPPPSLPSRLMATTNTTTTTSTKLLLGSIQQYERRERPGCKRVESPPSHPPPLSPPPFLSCHPFYHHHHYFIAYIKPRERPRKDDDDDDDERTIGGSEEKLQKDWVECRRCRAPVYEPLATLLLVVVPPLLLLLFIYLFNSLSCAFSRTLLTPFQRPPLSLFFSFFDLLIRLRSVCHRNHDSELLKRENKKEEEEEEKSPSSLRTLWLCACSTYRARVCSLAGRFRLYYYCGAGRAQSDWFILPRLASIGQRGKGRAPDRRRMWFSHTQNNACERMQFTRRRETLGIKTADVQWAKDIKRKSEIPPPSSLRLLISYRHSSASLFIIMFLRFKLFSN